MTTTAPQRTGVGSPAPGPREFGHKLGWLGWCDEDRTRPVVPDHRAYLALDRAGRAAVDARRDAWNAQLPTVEHPRFRHVADEFRRLLRRNVHVRNGSSRRGWIIDGPSGVGKTTVLQEVGREFHRQRIADHGVDALDHAGEWQTLPVCYVSMSKWTGKQMFHAVLHFYGAPWSPRDDLGALQRRVVSCLRGCRTELLLLDDFHHVKHLDGKNGLIVYDLLRHLQNSAPVTIAGSTVDGVQRGLFTALARADERHSAEFAGRFVHHRVDEFDDSEKDVGEFTEFLTAVEEQLVLYRAEPGDLSDERLAERIWRRTHGNVLAIVELLADCALQATADGTERITLAHVDGWVPDSHRRSAEVPLDPGGVPTAAPRKNRRPARR